MWWVRSEEAATRASEYAALAGKLGLEVGDAADQPAIIEAVRRQLEQRSRWLLVFDNVPGPSALGDFLPRGGTGHILITSRDPNWGGVAATLPVEVFDRAELVAFLLRRTGETDENPANALANELGDLPLALEQAAAYIEVTGGSIRRYLDLFRQRRKGLLAKGEPPADYEYTVATTWAMSFQEVKKTSAVAADLLRLTAFLAPDDIPREVLSEGAEHLPEPLRSATSDPLALDEREKMQALVDRYYETFVSIVAQARKMDEAQVRSLGTGEVYWAPEAREIGLVDELWDLDRAVDLAAELSGAPRRPYFIRPRRGLRERFMGPLAETLVESAVEEVERRLWMGLFR